MEPVWTAENNRGKQNHGGPESERVGSVRPWRISKKIWA